MSSAFSTRAPRRLVEQSRVRRNLLPQLPHWEHPAPWGTLQSIGEEIDKVELLTKWVGAWLFHYDESFNVPPDRTLPRDVELTNWFDNNMTATDWVIVQRKMMEASGEGDNPRDLFMQKVTETLQRLVFQHRILTKMPSPPAWQETQVEVMTQVKDELVRSGGGKVSEVPLRICRDCPCKSCKQKRVASCEEKQVELKEKQASARARARKKLKDYTKHSVEYKKVQTDYKKERKLIREAARLQHCMTG